MAVSPWYRFFGYPAEHESKSAAAVPMDSVLFAEFPADFPNWWRNEPDKGDAPTPARFLQSFSNSLRKLSAADRAKPVPNNEYLQSVRLLPSPARFGNSIPEQFADSQHHFEYSSEYKLHWQFQLFPLPVALRPAVSCPPDDFKFCGSETSADVSGPLFSGVTTQKSSPAGAPAGLLFA